MKMLRLFLALWLAIALPLQAVVAHAATPCRHAGATATGQAIDRAAVAQDSMRDHAHHLHPATPAAGGPGAAHAAHAPHAQPAAGTHCGGNCACAAAHCLPGPAACALGGAQARALEPQRHLLAAPRPAGTTRAPHAAPPLRPPSTMPA